MIRMHLSELRHLAVRHHHDIGAIEMFGMLRNAAVAVLLLGSSSIAFAQSDTSKVDLSGNWTFTVVYEGGQGTPSVRLRSAATR